MTSPSPFPMPFDLSGKVALVTGAGRGLGAAMAAGLASAGAQVVCAARTRSEVEATAGAIVDEGNAASAACFDATTPDSCRDLITEVCDRFGKIDVMVVNHGVGYAVPAEKISADEWHEMMSVNLTGCFNCAQSAGQKMIEQGHGGAIILVSSNASIVAFEGLTSYAVSKAGVDQLARQLALEWGCHNIRVNTINPGYMTHAMRGADDRYHTPELDRKIATRTPLQRRGAPEELIGPVVFLASDASSFITGHNMPIDGGYTIL